MKNEIVFYHSDELPERIEVRMNEETVWLNRHQMSALFGRDVKTIGKHINNVFREGELQRKSTVANFATVQKEGDRTVERQIEYYNLDVIISVGYRVKSKQGTQFRIWATQILRDYLLKGYALNQRMNRIENNFDSLSAEVSRISLQLQTHDLPKQGVFFDGQVYDAYVFTADLVRKARKSIVLIDNYIDDSVFTLFSKRRQGVSCVCYTRSISKSLRLDLEKYNAQYPLIKLKTFHSAHDRFLIIDDCELYHIGASLKDLGKKWFAFSKMDIDVIPMLRKLETKI